MDERTAIPEEAKIHFLQIPLKDQERLRRIINRIWFFYHIEITEQNEPTHKLIETFHQTDGTPLADLFFADFRSSSRLTNEQTSTLISALHKMRTPLISLAECEQIKIYDKDQHWLHITLPEDQIEPNIEDIISSITNFWFCLPSTNPRLHHNAH